MKPSFLENVLRGAEALAARDPVGLLPDKELLKRFTADRDPSAFAVLVRRHGPLVWGVCRNLLLEDSEAEDAFQATFLALVKSASSVNRPEALGGWLHGVAYRVAMKARRSAARRKKRETAAAASEENNPVADGAWDELQAAVHEEVCRLPEKLRLPFVLVGLQGRPQKEAAKQLGWAVGTFSARLSQARQRLLDRLAKRNMPVGMAASATALGVVSGSAAVPSAVVMKALNVVSAPDAVTPFVISLSRGVTQMYLTRTKILVAAVLVAGILTTGIGARLMSNAEAQTPEVIEEVERKLEAMREQQAKGRWEYKFVPLEKALPASELQRVLVSYDREGWEYCGSQDIASKGRPISHLTFKRPNKVAAPSTERERKLQETLKAYLEQEAMETKKSVKTPEEMEKLYLRALEAQYRDAALKQKSEEAQKAEAEARQRAEAELKRALEADLKARFQMLEAEAAKAYSLKERDRATQLQKQLEVLKAEHAALLKLLEAQKKAEGGGEKKPADSDVLVIPLKHVNVKTAADMLAKHLSEMTAGGLSPVERTGNKDERAIRISFDERTNSLLVQGPAERLSGLKSFVAVKIDLDPSASPILKQVVTVLSLEHVNLNQKEVIAILTKALPNIEIVAEARNDRLAVKGTPGAIADVQAILTQLAQSDLAKRLDTEGIASGPITLKNITLEDANKELLKHWPDKRVLLVMDPKDKSISLTGPVNDVTKAKLLVVELDAAAGKPRN